MNHKNVVDLEELLRVPYIEPYAEFDLSPDGKQVAFSWNPDGQWEIFLLPLDLSAQPQQITNGPGAKVAPRWSPDGSHVAYVVDLDGSELYDIHTYHVEEGEHRNLTPNSPDAIQPDISWSPDGCSIAFLSDRTGNFEPYIINIEGIEARQVLRLHHPGVQVRWSPNGRWLAVIAETFGQDFGTFIISVEGDEVLEIALQDVVIPAQDARWSPDSCWLAFTSDLHGFFNIGLYEVTTRTITWVTQGKADKIFPAWSPDGRSLTYLISKGPATSLAVLDLETGAERTYQVDEGTHYCPRFTPDGNHIVFIFDNPCSPSDLWLLSRLDDSYCQLTHSLPLALQASDFVMPKEVWYPSFDGQMVPALLYLQSQADVSARCSSKPLPPAVISVHGGPNWLAQLTWNPLAQHMVSRGWVILAPNYRGSTGYGREWQLANRYDLGGGDTRDVVAGAEYLLSEGIVDPNRIAITGRSYGGYLTMTSLTQYPEQFVAGSAVVPFLNWFTSHVNSREDMQHWDIENLGDPSENYELWRERSPFFSLDRIRVPIQLISGANDPRCPASESTQAYDVLIAQDKECDLIIYSDEGHSFLKTETQVDAKRRRIAFLARVFGEESNDIS